MLQEELKLFTRTKQNIFKEESQGAAQVSQLEAFVNCVENDVGTVSEKIWTLGHVRE